MAIPGPFPEKAEKDTLVESQSLFNLLKPLTQDPQYASSNFAVMYLRPTQADYAGWNLDKPRFSASVLKSTVLYAAYELRNRAKLAAPGMKADVVLGNLEAAWKPIVQHAVAGPPNFPQLAEIFNPYTSTVGFRDDFLADLKSMATYSNTEASGRVIAKLGHQYINGVLAKQGLYSRQKSGLWVGGNYNQIAWHPSPGHSSYYTATPRALLRYLNLLYNNSLITTEVSKEMKSTLANFYSERIWTNTPGEYDDAKSYGKLGWEYMKNTKIKILYDAAVIARTSSSGNFDYGIVIQGLTASIFSKLVVELDNIMVGFHP